VTFDDLDLVAPLRAAVAAAGYRIPTPIQAQAIPPALDGRDVLGCAQTGTGKTAAFALPILQHVDRVAGRSPRLLALVLTPTRELAAQIAESFGVYGRQLKVWHTVIFGGVNDKPQIAELERGVDVLVATPGRLLDLMQRGAVRLDDVEIFVLDEADRMLDMGFIHDVRRITRALPRERQTLFFSATMPREIRELADGLLHDPVYVAVAPPATAADRIEQRIYFTEKSSKPGLLAELLRATRAERALVFSRTKHGANRVVKQLERDGIRASAIHGNKSQAARMRALEGFRQGDFPVLVATDLAARGLDVSGITHVINYDLPNEPETYVHRIGRTARAGASGVARSLCDPEEREHLAGIERLLGRRLERGGVEPTSFASPSHPRVASAQPRGPSGSGAGRPRRYRRNSARPS